jgi:fido (protein-threonine AMPylation protein)
LVNNEGCKKRRRQFTESSHFDPAEILGKAHQIVMVQVDRAFLKSTFTSQILNKPWNFVFEREWMWVASFRNAPIHG